MKTFAEKLDSRFSKNRIYWDSIVRIVWTEQAIPFEYRNSEQQKWWLDIMCPSYVCVKHADCLRKQGIEIFDLTSKSSCQYIPARQLLKEDDIEVLQHYINTHYTESVTEFRMQVKEAGIFSDCQTSGLDDIALTHRSYERKIL